MTKSTFTVHVRLSAETVQAALHLLMSNLEDLAAKHNGLWEISVLGVQDGERQLGTREADDLIESVYQEFIRSKQLAAAFQPPTAERLEETKAVLKADLPGESIFFANADPESLKK